jgi:hypothetical protein
VSTLLYGLVYGIVSVCTCLDMSPRMLKPRCAVLQQRDVCLPQDDAFKLDPQLDGLTIEQIRSPDGTMMSQQRQDGAEQLTVNVPGLLDRPVPAKPNPMARFVESSRLPCQI